ncbi:MAG: hydantoinase/oxoprolinase family protein [Acidimicrobiales bacterium]|nr:hydantoinase/oxoprolinase family protein [Acidimicrobiales bacterium]
MVEGLATLYFNQSADLENYLRVLVSADIEVDFVANRHTAGMQNRSLRLGIDTGGTFTDAALVDEAGQLLAWVKAPTTHDDLITGILGALEGILEKAALDGFFPSEISVVSLSTTLATNAMVERTGSGAAIVLVGFDPGSTARIDGLERAVDVLHVPGGHDAHGRTVQELDTTVLARGLDRLADGAIDAVAVAGMFAVRNRAHEVAVRDAIATHPRLAGVPVTCTHDLTGRLNGPRRAATALANAFLTVPVSDLLDAFLSGANSVGIRAPLVVVRSDGSVMSLNQARERPVDTILSGPAASLLGGVQLSGVDSGVVVDIGGTTTDVAVVSDRIPVLSDDGAVVGGTATMVRSPLITTEGLGGDSEVSWHEQDRRLLLGPGRVLPISVAAITFPEINKILAQQQARRPLADTDGLFLVTAAGDLLEAAAALPTRRDLIAARRDAARGQLRFVGLTPTDAALVAVPEVASRLERTVDPEAAQAGLAIFARCLTRLGVERYASPTAAAQAVLRAVELRTGEIVAGAVGVQPAAWTAAIADATPSIARVSVQLDRPIIGIGASAFLYHPALEAMFTTPVLVPFGSEVANAVGAAVGSVRIQDVAVITQPKRRDFVLHRPGDTTAFENLATAEIEAETRLRTSLLERHAQSGLFEEGDDPPEVQIVRKEKVAKVDGTEFFVECRLEGTLMTEPGTN